MAALRFTKLDAGLVENSLKKLINYKKDPANTQLGHEERLMVELAAKQDIFGRLMELHPEQLFALYVEWSGSYGGGTKTAQRLGLIDPPSDVSDEDQ